MDATGDALSLHDVGPDEAGILHQEWSVWQELRPFLEHPSAAQLNRVALASHVVECIDKRYYKHKQTVPWFELPYATQDDLKPAANACQAVASTLAALAGGADPPCMARKILHALMPVVLEIEQVDPLQFEPSMAEKLLARMIGPISVTGPVRAAGGVCRACAEGGGRCRSCSGVYYLVGREGDPVIAQDVFPTCASVVSARLRVLITRHLSVCALHIEELLTLCMVAAIAICPSTAQILKGLKPVAAARIPLVGALYENTAAARQRARKASIVASSAPIRTSLSGDIEDLPPCLRFKPGEHVPHTRRFYAMRILRTRGYPPDAIAAFLQPHLLHASSSRELTTMVNSPFQVPPTCSSMQTLGFCPQPSCAKCEADCPRPDMFIP